MFKAIFMTKDEIKYPHLTLNKRIISEKRENISFSLDDSPVKKQKIIGQINVQQGQYLKGQNFEFSFRVNYIIGQLKLFHQYHFIKSQQSIQKSLIQKKRQQATILAHLKTNIICVLNICSQSDKLKILSQLKQIDSQIQYLDVFIVDQSAQYKKLKQQNKQILNFVIYLKDSLFSDQLFKILYKQFQLLPIYLNEIIIVQRNQIQDISYQQIMNFFKYCQNKNQLQQNISKQIQFFEKRWIQLPKCPKCLLKLQFQISGIQDKILFIASQNKIKQSECLTCQIIQKHKKSLEQNRKLSYQQDYKIEQKSQKHTHCDDCKEKTDVWICMVCSSVGCGRYKNADAYKHFVKSGHAITIDLETQRVWNYLSDCFSHKLLKTMNQTNFKISELKNQQSKNIQQATLQAAFWQYCSIFSEQMQRQKLFYDKMKNSKKQKFQNESYILDKAVENLLKQKQEKQNYLKKLFKQKIKYLKKEKQINEKVQTDRQFLKQYQQNLGNLSKVLNIQIDGDILHKRKQLQQLQKQMNQILIKLSN